jgi:hypothetical protein
VLLLGTAAAAASHRHRRTANSDRSDACHQRATSVIARKRLWGLLRQIMTDPAGYEAVLGLA